MQASVSVRKGRPLASFEFKVDFQFGRRTEAGHRVDGAISIPDFSTENAGDGDYEARATVVQEDDAHEELKNTVRKDLLPKLRERLRNFGGELCALETKQHRLDADRRLRDEENRLRITAENEKATEKARISVAESDKDEKRRVEELKKIEQSTSPLPLPSVPFATSSVWNVNSYHWEERPMTDWAKLKLTSLLEGASLELSADTKVNIYRVEVTGEASITVRKRKKIVVYDLAVTGSYTGEQRAADGSLLMDAKGGFTIAEFTAPDDYQISFTYDSDQRCRLETYLLVKGEMGKRIKPLLEKFDGEMWEK
eukprot:GHVU01034908.1.p1 GENE.GHVU01034908.1~~GHVU01034908.1.p1  ORF type:complete len:311 (+),score=64.49 GHVU01034908.1:1219-2151(+)